MEIQQSVSGRELEVFGALDLTDHAGDVAANSGGGRDTEPGSLFSTNDKMSKAMKKLLLFVCSLGVGAAAPLSASASTIVLVDNLFTSVTYENTAAGPLGPIIGFTETSAGVSFDFARISGQFRKIGPWGSGVIGSPSYAADVGGGGGSVTSFSLTTSHDVLLNSFSGLGAGSPLVNPVFSVTGGAVSSIGNTFSSAGFIGSPPTTNSFVGGPLALAAGISYIFDFTNAGVVTTGHFTSFNFTKVTTPTTVPLPAALPLLAGGLGLVGVMGWRRKKSSA
ncbi:MAG: hypothetical protein Tsb0019_31710 [Roseibium sp.]